jgi:hypothetical protein
MLLKNKVSVIYGAGGAIGGAAAKTFVREGAPRSIGPVGGANQSAPSRTRYPPTALRRTPPKPTSSTRRRWKRRVAGRQLPGADQLYLRMQFLTARAAAGRMAKAGSGESS